MYVLKKMFEIVQIKNWVMFEITIGVKSKILIYKL